MIRIYRSNAQQLVQLDEINVKGSWINLTAPTEEEIQYVSDRAHIMGDFLRAALDEEEKSRLEIEDDQVLIIIDIPVNREEDRYETIPLAIIINDNYIVTVCLERHSIIEDFVEKNQKTFYTFKKTRFLFQILFKTATLYLNYLRQIDKKTSEIERKLHISLKNKQLIRLLSLEKALVYFTTSLRSNGIVMEKLMRFKNPKVDLGLIKMYEEDEDLLEDVIIENKQAIEMADVYSNILTGTMDAYASIISNNLNIVMKILTSVTIILSIPTMVSSFFGMNVSLPFQNSHYGFVYVVGIAFSLSTVCAFILTKKKMF